MEPTIVSGVKRTPGVIGAMACGVRVEARGPSVPALGFDECSMKHVA